MTGFGQYFAARSRRTPGDPTRPIMIAGDIPDYWKPPIWLRSLTPILTPTDPNITRLRPTRLDEDPPEIPVWQGILRHDWTPGHSLRHGSAPC